MINLLESNRKKWEAREAAECTDEVHTELSDVEPEIVISEEEELTKLSSGTPSIIEFIRPPPT